MEGEGAICSEVHSFSAEQTKEGGTQVATFRFTVPASLVSTLPANKKDPDYDSDGDLEVPRRGGEVEEVLHIEHDLCTPLEGVGRQVCRGSLLLADYLLENCQMMKDSRILELGTGTGLTAIIAAFCGASVTATDIDNQGVLEKIKSNIERNRKFVPNDITVRCLDLTTDRYQALGQDYDLILAGDLIYDDRITDALVDFTEDALKTRPRLTVIISM